MLILFGLRRIMPCLVCFCGMIIINATLVQGQISSVPATYKSQEHEELGISVLEQPRHSFGFGLSIIAGDASAGRETVLLSSVYSYKLTKATDIECSLHYHSTDIAFNRTSSLGMIYTSAVWNGDGCIYTCPFASWQSFRIGAGFSIRHHVSSSTRNFFMQSPNGQVTTIRDVVYQKALSAGGSVKIDIILASFRTMDVILRGQGYIYALPISGDNYQTPFGVPGGAASIQVLVQGYF
jgi:hypothetical protein